MASVDQREFVTRVNELDPLTFEQMVREALVTSGRFADIRPTCQIGTVQVDLVAKEIKRDMRQVAIEIKHRRAVDVGTVRALIGTRAALLRLDSTHDFVVIVSGLLTAAARQEAALATLEIWDGSILRELIPQHIQDQYLRRSGTSDPPKATRARGAALLDSLKNVVPGKQQWVDYQRLIAEIVEYLFVPPLTDMVVELSDESRRNRRDIILANPVVDDFWFRMRADYAAHYVVIDAKNYEKPLGKKPVLEIAHYLKAHGAGLFALLVCRAGAGAAAKHAIREQWIAGGKMIIPLGDEDVRDMLQMRDGGGRPEEIVRQAIDAFRLSL